MLFFSRKFSSINTICIKFPNKKNFFLLYSFKVLRVLCDAQKHDRQILTNNKSKMNGIYTGRSALSEQTPSPPPTLTPIAPLRCSQSAASSPAWNLSENCFHSTPLKSEQIEVFHSAQCNEFDLNGKNLTFTINK